MGLDMYLTKQIYVGAKWEHRNVSGNIKISVDGKPLNVKFDRVQTIIEEVGYWRKANQIHAWFVKNVQGGEDNCQEFYVTKEQLTTLLGLCKKIKAKCKLMAGVVANGYTFDNEGNKKPIMEDGQIMTNQEYAHKLLPTHSGFFFGSTDYDEYYLSDIESTIEIIEAVLSDEDGEGDYYYRASW